VTRRASLLLAAALLTLACGRKTDVRPPEDVAPKAVNRLALNSAADGVVVSWARPTETIDGGALDDLAGFVVSRSTGNDTFAEIGRVAVTDRGRFQKVKRFELRDGNVAGGGVYHYSVVAFTTDGYYSAPSGVATITWWPPVATPTPQPTPE
jgi:hypothetical protein